MSRLDEWSVRLAEAMAPDEAAEAPQLAADYVAGGQAREAILAGGLSPRGAGTRLLPFVLEAIDGVAGALLSALASDRAGDYAACARNGLMLVDLKLHADEALGAAPAPPAPAPPPQSAIPQEDAYAPLRRIVDGMTAKLRAQGFDDERANLLTFQAVKMLFEQPEEARRFVGDVSARPAA